MPPRRPIAVAVVVAAALLGSGTPVLARGDQRSPSSRPTTTTTTTLPSGIDVGHTRRPERGRPPRRTRSRSSPPIPTTSTRCCTSASTRPRPAVTPCGPSWTTFWPASTGSIADVAAFDQLSADLVVQQRIVARRTVAARRQMVERAVGAYVAGNAPEIEAAYGAIEPNEVEERRTIVSTIMEADRDEAERLLTRRLDVTARLSRVLEQAEQTQAELRARPGPGGSRCGSA